MQKGFFNRKPKEINKQRYCNGSGIIIGTIYSNTSKLKTVSDNNNIYRTPV